MARFLKIVFFGAVLGFVALAAYAYLGPLIGHDLSAPVSEIRQDIELDLK